MAIIGNLPVNLQNGTTADASQVMSDLNYIVNQVNANAQPAGSYLTPGFISPGALVGIQVITASSTYTPTAGATKALFDAVAGGGAGGGSPNAASFYAGGSGGASGAYGRFWIPSGLQDYSGTAITIGAGGTGVSAGNGNAGGNTTFGSFVTLGGGPGGIAPGGSFSPPTALATTLSWNTLTALMTLYGQAGLTGWTQSGFTTGGRGAGSPLGTGGREGYWQAGVGNVAAIAGSGFGFGGAGACAWNGSNAMIPQAGANGGDGAMIFYEFE